MADFEIDATRVALALGITAADFRRLMEAGRIAVLCERGVGEDAGHHRVSFHHGRRRARWRIDGAGRFEPD